MSSPRPVSPRSSCYVPKLTTLPYQKPSSKTGTPSKTDPKSPRRQEAKKQGKEGSVQSDERFEEFQRKELQQLRKEKAEAIDAMDFDLSEFIEKVIQSKIKNAPVDASGVGSKWIKERVDQLLDAYFIRLTEINSEYESKAIEIRESELEVFEKIKEKHLLEIEELETARVVQLVYDENSVSGQAILLQKQARTLAKANDFNGARASAQKAEEIRVEGIEKRKAATAAKYDRELKCLLDTQEKQLVILQDRLNASINDNAKRNEEAILSLQRESGVFIKSQLQSLIVDGSKKLATNEQKAQFINDITAFYMKTILASEKQKECKLQFLYF